MSKTSKVGPEPSQVPRTQSRSCLCMAGIQVLSHHPLPPRVEISISWLRSRGGRTSTTHSNMRWEHRRWHPKYCGMCCPQNHHSCSSSMLSTTEELAFGIVEKLPLGSPPAIQEFLGLSSSSVLDSSFQLTHNLGNNR